MTTLPFADSLKTGLLAAGWYANRLGHDAFPGVLALCYHGVRESAADERHQEEGDKQGEPGVEGRHRGSRIGPVAALDHPVDEGLEVEMRPATSGRPSEWRQNLVPVSGFT